MLGLPLGARLANPREFCIELGSHRSHALGSVKGIGAQESPEMADPSDLGSVVTLVFVDLVSSNGNESHPRRPTHQPGRCESRAVCRRSLVLSQEVGDARGAAACLLSLAGNCQLRGDRVSARARGGEPDNLSARGRPCWPSGFRRSCRPSSSPRRLAGGEGRDEPVILPPRDR
jgi:hypothetical protein